MQTIISIVLLLSVATPCFAGKLYYWTDKDGVKHVSDRRPMDAIGVESELTKERERRTSGDDKAERRAIDRLYRQHNAEEEHRKATIEYNRKRQESETRYKKEKKERELSHAQKVNDFYKSKEEWYRYHENNAYDEEDRLYWKGKRQEGEKAEQRLKELQGQ